MMAVGLAARPGLPRGQFVQYQEHASAKQASATEARAAPSADRPSGMFADTFGWLSKLWPLLGSPKI